MELVAAALSLIGVFFMGLAIGTYIGEGGPR